jgi:hypothetical protein
MYHALSITMTRLRDYITECRPQASIYDRRMWPRFTLGAQEVGRRKYDYHRQFMIAAYQKSNIEREFLFNVWLFGL